ncbi:MAG: PEP-CTERM system TPR-repeat protein PrsT [Rubrivivax sp.]
MSLCLVLGAAQAASNPKAAGFYEDALKRYQAGDIAGSVIQLKNVLKIDKSMLQAHLLLGQALLANSDVAAAEVAFEEALRLGVSRAEVVLPLARAVSEQGRPQDLLTKPRFALEGLPRDVQFSLQLAKASAASDMGEHRDALRLLEEARALGGSPAAAWLAEVPIRIRAGQFREAQAAAQRVVAEAPSQAESHYAVASVHHAQGHAAAALEAYNLALARSPKHLESLVGRAGILLDLGRFESAEADIRTLRQVQPKEPRAAYLAAVIAQHRGDTAAARAALTELTALLDPVPPEFLRFRPQLLMLGGLAHYGLGQTEKAKPYLQGVQKLQGNIAVSKLLAQIYISEGNIDGAINALDGYLKIAPRDIAAIELLAQAHLAAGRPARSVAVLRTALQSVDVPRLRTGLGLALMRVGKTKEAVSELEAAWSKDPGQVRAGAALANAYAAGRELTKATRIAEALVKKHPTNPGLQDLLGTVRVRAGDRVAARKAFDEAARLDPKAAAPRINLARLDAAAGQPSAAAARLEAVLKDEPRNIDAMLEMAWLSERRTLPDQALLWYTKAADASSPKDLRAAISLVSFHLRSGQAPEALKATERLAAGGSEDLAVLLTTVRAQIANGDLSGPKSLLTRATALAQFDPAVQVEIAILQLAIGNTAGAYYSIEKALATEPDQLHANAVLVDVLLRQNDLERAEKTARRISAWHPKRAIGPTLEGDVAAARGQLAAAVALYRRAHALEPSPETLIRLHRQLARTEPAAARTLAEQWIRAHPKDVAVRREHADTLARSGLDREARQAYEALLALAPEDGRALNNLANVLIRLNDPSALQVAERALRVRPQHAEVIDTVAWAAFRAGQKDRALQMLRDARLRAPENPEIRYHLAVVLADAGRSAEARQELEATLQPGRPFASMADARTLLQTLK